MRPYALTEPTFEPPPWLSWPFERRLSCRAVAIWEACCRNGRLPAAAEFEHGELAGFCAESSVGIVAAADGTAVARVGTAVAATFGLACGMLVTTEPRLGARLGRAFAELRHATRPVSFETSFIAGPVDSGERTLLLTRGVLLPLLDAAGELTQALAILTWKEALSDAASERLRREIDGAHPAGGAEDRAPALPRAKSLYAVFARAPSLASPSRDGHAADEA